MTDLDTLLSQAAHSPAGPVPDGVVDADLVRGRRALNHRRMRRTGTRSVLAGALAIGAFAAYSPGTHPATSTTAGKPATGAKTPTLTTTKSTVGAAPAGIKLVAWTGEQPKGYTVDSVPAGWEIQGVDNFTLDIAPVGFPDQDISDFVGKLVVMLASKDETGTPTGTPVSVNGRPGVVNHDEDAVASTLSFTDAAGHKLDIQVPPALHWTDAQIAAFGASVHVSATAEAGVG
jgi:hypothetical protein